MKLYLLFFFLLVSLQVHSQSSSIKVDKTGNVNPWNHLEFNNNPENFQFAIVTDRTEGHRDGVLEDAVKRLNLLQPEFVMSVGDMIEGYTRDEAEIYRQWDEFNGFIGKLHMPFFYVPGNHDYINDVIAKIWEKDLFPENKKCSASYDDSYLYYDISVPVKWLEEMAGADWKDLRVNVAVNDADFNGSITTLFWQPEWRSEANVIGSGIFKK